MSYQVLARKWRPQTFDEVAGQSHVTTPLRNAIRADRVPHAVLLTGPRGTGKTTLARILAKCLNCEKGPTADPCGGCPSCVEITEGRSTDVQEIDAASRTSVDDVRELIEAIRYAAAPGRHRIFVVDEVHMLSTAAFNALLKTLEEPPPRSLFVFATTNPEKIPFTVVSRCQRYDLRRIPRAEVAANLAHIAESEGVKISETSLLAIAREGDGSLRDSQTLLDQIIAYGGDDIADETVVEVLDLIDRRLLLAILEACVDRDPAAALEACHRAIESGADPKRLSADLVQLLRDLVVLLVAPDAEGLVEGAQEEVAELRSLAGRAEPMRLRRMFRALIQEQEDLTWAPQPHAVLEMAVVRLASLAEGDDVGQLLTRLDALERRLAGEEPQGGGPTSGGGPTRSGGGGTGRPASQRGDAGGASRRGRTAGGRARAQEDPPVPAPRAAQPNAAPAASPASQPEPPVHPEPSAPAAASGGPGGDAPDEVVYDRLRGFAQDINRGLFASLDGGRIAARDGDRIVIAVSGGFHLRRLRDRKPELDDVCARFFGRRVPVELVAADEPEPGAGGTPPNDRERARQRRQAALNHPAINVALRELQGEIVDIKPLGARER